MQYHAASGRHEDHELTRTTFSEPEAASADEGPRPSGIRRAYKAAEEPRLTWESGGCPDEAPEAWDRFPRTRRFDAWIAGEDERLESDIELTRSRVEALDRFVRTGSKRLLGDEPSPAWTMIVGAMVIAAWDAARRLSGVPEMCVAEGRGGSPFGSIGAALRFAIYDEAVLGVGPLSLVVAEDRDEDRVARSRATRAGAEFVIARQSRAGSTGGTKSQARVELRSDVLRAISASNVGLIDLALLLQADVGLWRPAGVGATERTVVDYARWRLGAELAERAGGEAERLARAVEDAERRAEVAAQARAACAARVEDLDGPETVETGLADAWRALEEANRRAEALEMERDAVRAKLAKVSDVGLPSVTAARDYLERLPPTVTRVPGALMRELARRWGASREQIERAAIEWRAANPAGPVELVRLKSAEIAQRLASLAADGPGAEVITPQAIGRRIAASRRVLIEELARRGLVPPPAPRRRRATGERPSVAGYVSEQARWQR